MGPGSSDMVRLVVRSRHVAVVLLAVLVIVVVLGSVRSREVYIQGDTPEDILRHVLAYGAIAFVAVHVFLQSAYGLKASFMTGVFLVVCFGTSLELVQSWMPYRNISAMDQLSNTGGALAGGVVRVVFGLFEGRSAVGAAGVANDEPCGEISTAAAETPGAGAAPQPETN